MTIQELLQIISSFIFNQDLVTRGLLLILLFVYVLFSIVLTRQIFILTKVIDQISFSPIFKMIAILHLLASVVLSLLTLLSLQ